MSTHPPYHPPHHPSYHPPCRTDGKADGKCPLQATIALSGPTEREQLACGSSLVITPETSRAPQPVVQHSSPLAGLRTSLALSLQCPAKSGIGASAAYRHLSRDVSGAAQEQTLMPALSLGIRGSWGLARSRTYTSIKAAKPPRASQKTRAPVPNRPNAISAQVPTTHPVKQAYPAATLPRRCRTPNYLTTSCIYRFRAAR